MALTNGHQLKTCSTDSGEELHKTDVSTATPFLAQLERVGSISTEARQTHNLTLFATLAFQMTFQEEKLEEPTFEDEGRSLRERTLYKHF